MKYVLADADKCAALGFRRYCHSVVNGVMTLTEKELMHSPLLTGNEEERLAAVGGRIVTK